MDYLEIIGTMIAAITLVVGIKQWKIQRKKEVPSLDTKGLINFKDFIFEVSICNTGNAPAKIISLDLYFNNSKVSMSDLINVVNQKFPQTKTIEIGSFAPGQVVPAPSEQVLFKITFGDIRPPVNELKTFMFDEGRVTINYESLDGIKFTFDSRKRTSR